MKAVVYIRVSSDEQVQGTSLTTQEAACRDWCQRSGADVLRVFSDAGESAKTAHRPAFLELIAFCQAHHHDLCVVWKFDRWARNSSDHHVYAAALARAGTRLVSATEPTADDPAGRLLEAILAGVAQFDNEVRGARARLGMAEVARRGFWYSNPPIGFHLGKVNGMTVLREDPARAPFVRDLFDGIATGRRTHAQTRVYAREFGLGPQTIWRLLRNPIYAGIIRGPLTGWREIPASFPGLVPLPMWRNVQAIIASARTSAKRTKVRSEFPLRGLLLCYACGRRVTAATTRGNGGSYGYYFCRRHMNVRATVVHAEWDNLLRESATVVTPVLNRLQKHVKDVVMERVQTATTLTKRKNRQTETLEAKRGRLLSAYVDGIVDQADFRRRDADLAQQIDRLRTTGATTDWSAEQIDMCVDVCVRLLNDPVAVWARLDASQRQRFAKALFGEPLALEASGRVRTTASAGIINTLQRIGDEKSPMVGRPGLLSHLTELVDAISDLAA